jgi:serine/threonine-protein kinase
MAATARRLVNERYRMGELLGEGATATVSHAFDELLRRDVAVKLLKPAFAQDATTVERFYAEARAAAGLVDPHVVSIYDVLADGRLHAIVMEYVDGPSLAAVLKREGTLDEPRAIGYARQIAQALGAAHGRGIIHRDVKPANVLLTPDDAVKVTDFGLAKAFTEQDPGLTEAGRLVGSAHYFSPEQAQGLPLTPASDLYSLGVLLYQMVSGMLPFDTGSPLAVAVAHVTLPPPAEAALVRVMTPGLAAIVARLLQKQPAARFASAAELDAALAALHDAPDRDAAWDTPTVIGGAPVVPAPARTRPARRMRPANAVRASAQRFAAASIAALGAAFAALATRYGRTTRPALDAVGRRIARHGAALSDVTSRRARATDVPTRAIAGAFILLVVVLAFVSTRPHAVALIDVRHRALAQARTAIATLGLTPAVALRPDRTIRAGTVIAQSPNPGTVMYGGDVVRLTVSSGVPVVIVPNVLGASFAHAVSVLRKAGLHPKFAARIADAPANTVIEQYPAGGTHVRSDAPGLVVISTGPHPNVVHAPADNGGGDGGD